MKALVFHRAGNVSVDNVEDPKIEDPKDIILKVTTGAICGSDLHLYNGYIPTVKDGDVLGHEFMGEVVDVGSDVKTLQVGERIVVPFCISCGYCDYCELGFTSVCDNSNRNAELAAKVYGISPAGLFGYSHTFGGYNGGQAEYVRVPYADANYIKIPEEIPDEKVLFLGDIFSTGWMAAESANIQNGSTVIVFGCGPVGQFAIRSAIMQGAERVIAVDRFEERLSLAEDGGAEVVNYEDEDSVTAKLLELTKGRGAPSVIDAVGMEAHGSGLEGVFDKVEQTVKLQSDRPTVLRMAIQVCAKAGTLSIAGVYGGIVDKLNIGAAFNKGLSFKMGQTHVHRYLDILLEKVLNEEIDPSFVITHTLPLDQAPEGYKIFRDKEDRCIKVVLKP